MQKAHALAPLLDTQLAGTLAQYFPGGNYNYLQIQRLVGGQWQTIHVDGDAYTAIDWARTGGDSSATSQATVTWWTRGELPGSYRVVYDGLAKHSLLGLLPTYVPFSGVSPAFQLQ